ncbi:MAG: hypothetical protein PHQ89_03900 [Bacilli bacterium]|nr:hypothetical protein [Bacilli bacterium]
MWNNFKSDIYRTIHMKSFYVVMGLMIVSFIMILANLGLQSNTLFAQFDREQNNFMQFLYFMPKCMMFSLLILIFIGIFSTEEYNSGYVKNVYSLQISKAKFVLGRYLYCVIIATFFYVVILLVSLLVQLVYPLTIGNFQLFDYIPFVIMQILTIATASSFSMLLANLTKSKVIVVLFSIAYGYIFYMIVGMLLNFMLHDTSALEWMMYVLSSKLPVNFAIEAYQKAFLVLIGNTLLYNEINYLILKKQDI